MLQFSDFRIKVLLTRSDVLADKLEVYTKRLIATQLNKSKSPMDGNRDMFHLSTRDDKEVKDTVFTITDENFPLVCTFNHFMKLLENTIKLVLHSTVSISFLLTIFRFANRKDFSVNRTTKISGDTSLEKRGRRLFRKAQVVDFGVFSGEYWPSFPNGLTKAVPVELAFMEIIGVIKGSACRSLGFLPLGRDEYRENGHKISPVSADRDLLYDIYECYEKRKRELGDVDDTDRARLVLEAISNNTDLREKIERAFDEVYVDGRRYLNAIFIEIHLS